MDQEFSGLAASDLDNLLWRAERVAAHAELVAAEASAVVALLRGHTDTTAVRKTDTPKAHRIAPSEPLDPATHWLENWPPRPGEIDPKDEKLWLTKGRAERDLGVGKTKIDELIRDYDISVEYGGRRLLNRYRAFAALHANLPRRARTGVSG